MADTDVGRRRAYRSQVREAQARATRHAVVSAAAALFVERGYAATTIDAVADHAGVSRKTVFSAVDGGKATLLRLAWDRAIVGDDEPVPMMDRPAVRQMQEEPDPLVVVGLQARLVREVSARAASIGRVVAAAADVDPDVAALQRTTDRQRLFGATMFVRSLQERGGLRPGLSVERAAEMAWALMDPSLYGRLVDQRGWSTSEYEHWVRDLMVASLLAVTAP